jgi:hypothetical protein
VKKETQKDKYFKYSLMFGIYILKKDMKLKYELFGEEEEDQCGWEHTREGSEEINKKI